MVSCYVWVEILYWTGVPIQMIDGCNICQIDGLWVHQTCKRYLMNMVMVPMENWYVTFLERIYNILVRNVLRNWYYGNFQQSLWSYVNFLDMLSLRHKVTDRDGGAGIW